MLIPDSNNIYYKGQYKNLWNKLKELMLISKFFFALGWISSGDSVGRFDNVVVWSHGQGWGCVHHHS